ncbi:MAG: hypothetical protein ABIR54_11995 [Burkholderiaceae bacterium]
MHHHALAGTILDSADQDLMRQQRLERTLRPGEELVPACDGEGVLDHFGKVFAIDVVHSGIAAHLSTLALHVWNQIRRDARRVTLQCGERTEEQ